MQKPISPADHPAAQTRTGSVAPHAVLGAVNAVNIAIITLDSHIAAAMDRARPALARDIPGLSLSLHVAAEWEADPDALAAANRAIANAHFIIVTMMFMDDHIRAVLPALQARADATDAIVCCMSAGEVIRLTRLGNFRMDKPARGPLALLKRLRGKSSGQSNASSGAGQMAMLRRLPKILRFIPGTAQDVRAYFLTLQYWLAGTDDNMAALVRMLVDRYAAGPRAYLRGTLKVAAPTEYPETGLYHPRAHSRMFERIELLPKPLTPIGGTVGLLVMRSYVLAGDTAHYDGVIASLEARGLAVIPAFAAGLDSRPAVERYFFANGKSTVDAVISLTGFSLVGGPAYNDASAAEDVLARLDVPYLAAHALEFQSLEAWRGSDRGLMPVEATMMVAIPELDGATSPMVFGGRSDAVCEAGAEHICEGCVRACKFEGGANARAMRACIERAEHLAARAEKLVALRKSERAARKLAIVIFNFPPNAGATGTAAYLAVFESLYNTLKSLKAAGYTVNLPASVDALREAILSGNAAQFGADANVLARIQTDDHVRRETHLRDIEAAWGAAPGKQQANGKSIFVLGAQFGHVMVGVQPGFGYEGDPMRLLFEKGFAPTHAFSAFYRYIREDFGAHAVLHFGTHGALEFMPGKQSGLTDDCWPDRLIGDLPNIYLYAANNPSEGTIAKRRSAATLVSYLTPPVAHAGLYRGLLDLKASLERWRTLEPDADTATLAALIQEQATALDLGRSDAWADPDAAIAALVAELTELETTLIPHGLHVVGTPPSEEERVDLLLSTAEAGHGAHPSREHVSQIVRGERPKASDAAGLALLSSLAETDRLLKTDCETQGLITALDGRYVRPAPGGDLLRTPAILPTGRNLHGFDPFRIPSQLALREGKAQADRLIARHRADGHPLPRSVAIVLWGTDNLKTEGGPIAQALALMGACPRFDSYGRLAGAALIPLAELGRPRIDVVITLSGIFRDLLPLQTRMLAEAAFLAASADEPSEQNFIRAHALAHMAEHGGDLETASLRVFSNADGAYGANVNQLIDSGAWDEPDELAEAYSRRKCFAYGRSGKPQRQPNLLKSALAHVDLAYQNLESVELGVTTIDHYFDTLGGIGRAVERARGEKVAVYIGDQTMGTGKVRTLSEQVSLETRTRTLNPKWYEGMLRHGYEGVRQIEAQVTNTLGWSATTGEVAPWVYQQLTETFVLDADMRDRLARLNPKASVRVAHRLIEAHERSYWQPDAETLAALHEAGADLEDRLEGVATSPRLEAAQ